VAQLTITAHQANVLLADYRFDEAANKIYQFFWGDFCDWYLEIVKLRLDFADSANKSATKSALTTLLQAFESALRLLSPFMPFITEELWHALYDDEPPTKSIALTRYPTSGLEKFLDGLQRIGMRFGRDRGEMAVIQSVVVAARKLRKDRAVTEKEFVLAHIFCSPQTGSLTMGYILPHQDIFRQLARISSLQIATEPLSGPNVRSESHFDISIDYSPAIDIPAERERLAKELAKLEKGLTSAERQLSNPAFLEKAPPHVIEGLRKMEADTRLLIEKTRKALDDLTQEGRG
jgi:valyl-tRNA synthetase